MSELDKKLESLIGHFADYENHEEYHISAEDPERCAAEIDEEELLKRTKQAFIDAGWLDTTQLGGIKSTMICRPEGNIEFMTGQEWYSRFEKELAKVPFSALYGEMSLRRDDLVMDAAKKAAGLL